MKRISDERLVDLAAGRLSSLEAAALRTQIADDAPTLRRLADLEHLIGLMHDDTTVDAPEHVVARALRLIRPKEPLSRRLQRVTALLSSDSWRTRGLAPGLRSLRAWPRTIIMRAGDRELDLQIGPHGGQWQVRGQVLGPEAPGTVTLSGPAGHVLTALNDLGEFTLPLVASGRYTLTVTQGNLEIVVPNLELGPASSLR